MSLCKHGGAFCDCLEYKCSEALRIASGYKPQLSEQLAAKDAEIAAMKAALQQARERNGELCQMESQEMGALRERLRLAEAVAEAAEAFEVAALRGRPSSQVTVAYAKALKAWREQAGEK